MSLPEFHAMMHVPQASSNTTHVANIDWRICQLSPTCRECSQYVQSLCGLVIRGHHSLGVVRSWLDCEGISIYYVASIRWETNAVNHLVRFWSRLRKLPSHATNFDYWHRSTETHHQWHLQHDSESITNVIYTELVESFGAISSHKQKSLTQRCLCQFLL